jgi:hypothetical protein
MTQKFASIIYLEIHESCFPSELFWNGPLLAKDALSHICWEDIMNNDTIFHYSYQPHSHLDYNVKHWSRTFQHQSISMDALKDLHTCSVFPPFCKSYLLLRIAQYQSTGNVVYLLFSVMYMLVSVVYLLISIMQEMTIYGIRTISAYRHFRTWTVCSIDESKQWRFVFNDALCTV